MRKMGFLLLVSFFFFAVSAHAGLDELVRGNTRFACDLYQELADEPGNVFYSPYSISVALGMTVGGAQGKTETDMVVTMHFPKGRLHSWFKELIKKTSGEGKPFDLFVANRLWGQIDYGFLPNFLKGIESFYGAALEQVDFKNDSEKARTLINGWVAEKTMDKIQDLIPPGVLTSLTRLVLTNAIYFKGSWATKFNPKSTLEQEFFVTPFAPKKVSMMFLESSFSYYDALTYAVLELPYAGNELSMVAFLPKEKDGLSALEKQISQDFLQENLAKLSSPTKVAVYLPRYKVTQSCFLKDVLTQLGMGIAFGDEANFSRMNGRKDLQISQVIHKAFCEVNEEGTEAAAATAVLLKGNSVDMDGPPTPVFRADHPFFFVIRHKLTGSILFMGRVADPS